MRLPRGRSIQALGVLTLAVLLVGLSGTFAYPGDSAAGDGDRAATGCHSSGGSAAVTLSAPANALPGEEDLILQVTVDLGGSQDSDAQGSQIVGVMLLSEDGLIQQAGFVLAEDPNGNSPPVNYNEMMWEGSPLVFSWRAAAPASDGNYTLFARAMYDDGGPKYLESETFTMVVAQSQEPPGDNGTANATDNGGPSAGVGSISWRGMLAGLAVGGLAVVAVEILRRWNGGGKE
jgi:hypothetical protein